MSNKDKELEITGFDFFKSFLKTKKKFSDEEIEQNYVPLSMNILMSLDRYTCLLAAEINRRVFNFPKKAHFLYYYYGIVKRKYVPFLKVKRTKELKDVDELIEIAQKYLPEMSKEKIMDVLDLIEDQLLEVKRDINKSNIIRGKIDEDK